MTASTGNVVMRRRVRVWFGRTPISDLVVPPELAERHAVAMRRRFASVRVTKRASGGLGC